jgi:hypothetical protein
MVTKSVSHDGLGQAAVLVMILSFSLAKLALVVCSNAIRLNVASTLRKQKYWRLLVQRYVVSNVFFIPILWYGLMGRDCWPRTA